MKKDISFPDIKPLHINRYAKVMSIGVGIPKKVMTNQDIIDKYDYVATDRAVQFSIGIKERRWVSEDESLEGLMAQAIAQCLERANVDIESVDRIIYTRLLGAQNAPASAIAALKRLGVKKGIPGFDVTCACSGFMHVMDMALRYIASGDDYVLVIGGGITSKRIQQCKEPNSKTVFLFGDGIAAMLLGRSEVKHFLSSYLLTNHLLYDNALIPCGTTLLTKDYEDTNYDILTMKINDGKIILDSAIEYTKIIVDKLLSESKMTLDEVDHFITSDQSTKIWEAQLKALGIPFEKSLSLFSKYGNTVAAMSPLILNELISSKRIQRGDVVMMLAHGAGASSGGMIFRF
ncbi:ketoacyl-ACP synthase III [Herbivorax sp. ANBcel31]|uniref:ketoacyl-ACP synthase III n=1 Tax=Herbivorax sp. ANBcel31 TaxID=3069754 RepID=UPI0027B1D56B|nr:ketoacyl-ACP synthase III [Herbivorax sp. ANBcel31]MDQ2086121.1 ketoacyl-ACP synthase III [Herbivorax sp. ANBcel31]